MNMQPNQKLTKPDEFISLFKSVIDDLKKTGTDGEWHGSCPYIACREKKNQKFYVNEISGLYKCHVCGVAGNAIKFAKDFGKDLRPHSYGQRVSLVFDQEQLNDSQQYLTTHPELHRKPWRPDIVAFLGVGFDPRIKTEVYPVRSKDGQLINIINHKKFQTKHSRISLYPLDKISEYRKSYVLIPEGLPDVITALSNGIQAVTSTGGGSSIPKDISDLADMEYAFILPDNDRSGELSAEKWIIRLRRDLPHVRLRLCDISRFVGEKCDLTDYFSLPNKSRKTFIQEVMKSARVASLYSDLPNFIRDQMLSSKFIGLSPEDQALFVQLSMRVARYHVSSIHYRGLDINIPPGGYWTRYRKLLEYAPYLRGKSGSLKRVRNSISRLVRAGFIHKQNLNWQRGLLLTLTGWTDSRKGHKEGHSNSFTQDLLDYPPPPFWSPE